VFGQNLEDFARFDLCQGLHQLRNRIRPVEEVAARLRLHVYVITGARLAAGGVAPIPLVLRRTSELAVGRSLDLETLRALLAAAQEEISPISDVRGSAEYKRRLVTNLLVAQLTSIFTSAFPERFAADAIFGELFAGRLAS